MARCLFPNGSRRDGLGTVCFILCSHDHQGAEGSETSCGHEQTYDGHFYTSTSERESVGRILATLHGYLDRKVCMGYD